MRARLQTVLIKLASLPCWRPLRSRYMQLHSHLAKKFDHRPGFRGWLWRLIHVSEWQKSTAISSAIWVLGTLIVYKLVESLGYGWEINTGVSLVLDLLVYCAHKLWVFGNRQVTVAASGGKNFVAWALFLGVNITLAWLLMDRADMGTLPARGLLGCYGIAMNPVIFTIRSKVIFRSSRGS